MLLNKNFDFIVYELVKLMLIVKLHYLFKILFKILQFKS